MRRKFDLPEKYILYVGRLNARKNIRRLIQAFHEADIDPEIPLVLVGAKNWKMFNLDALVEELGVQDRIRRLGFVELEDLPALYSGARFFTFVPLAEGFGNPSARSHGLRNAGARLEHHVRSRGRRPIGILIDPLVTEEIRAGHRNVDAR